MKKFLEFLFKPRLPLRIKGHTVHYFTVYEIPLVVLTTPVYICFGGVAAFVVLALGLVAEQYFATKVFGRNPYE